MTLSRSLFAQYLGNEHLPKRILSSVGFACMFAFVAAVVPEVYYRYIDETRYLQIEDVLVDKTFYKPCDNVVVGATMTALTDIDAVFFTELVLVREDDNGYYRVPGSQQRQESPIHQSAPRIISSSLDLPCDLQEGRYYWQGNAVYKIRSYEKVESYVSNIFNVTKTGLSPVGQELQDKIEELSK